MTVYTIGNICKEIQRIDFDIKNEEYESARERCYELDELLSSIENGEHQIEIGDVIIRKY